jgi:hypothetical protein
MKSQTEFQKTRIFKVMVSNWKKPNDFVSINYFFVEL